MWEREKEGCTVHTDVWTVADERKLSALVDSVVQQHAHLSRPVGLCSAGTSSPTLNTATRHAAAMQWQRPRMHNVAVAASKSSRDMSVTTMAITIHGRTPAVRHMRFAKRLVR